MTKKTQQKKNAPEERISATSKQINSARRMPDQFYPRHGAPCLTLKLTKLGEKSNKRRAMEADEEYVAFRYDIKAEVIDSIPTEAGQMMRKPLTDDAVNRFCLRKILHRLKKTRYEYNYVQRRT